MFFKIDFGTDFYRFLDPTWNQVGIKIGSKIDVNFEYRFFEKTLFFLRKKHDFEGSKGCKIEENSMKNQVKSEGQDGMLLGIDF